MLFLAEAFTRPARLYGLAKLGFTQSYSYFTWRTAKWELEEFGRQIAEHADYARPNLFVNTPDILHESLQHGGPGMFAIRAVLAATMGTSWGVYSGYELFEHVAVRAGQRGVPGLREVRTAPARLRGAPWPRAARWSRSSPGSTRSAGVHPALCQLRTIRFHHVDNDALLAYSKFDPVTGDTVLVVVTLNPFGAEEGTVWLDMGALGMHALRPLLGARRDHRGGIPVGAVQLRAPRAGQGGRAHPEHAADPARPAGRPAAPGMTATKEPGA